MRTIEDIASEFFDFDNLDGPSFYFGEKWEAGITDHPSEQIDTPVGRHCINCGEEIKEGDQGSFYGSYHVNKFAISPSHRECSLRSVLGGINCLKGKCGEPNHNPDPEGLSKREGALAAWDYLQEHGWEGVKK